MVNPNIAIKLINTGKTVIQTNGNGDIKSVIYSIYGKDVATGILPVEYTFEDIQVNGVIGKPEIARSNRSNQLFFVNKRFIKDKVLSAATEQAFKGLIPIGKFGFVILNITMNPAKVDVNVHPAKLEVRFEDESRIFQSIYHAIKNTLLENELVANTEKSKELDRQENVEKQESKGLFDFRKNETKKIEQYNDQESKIKTNVGLGGPVNTADVLEQLRKMQQDLQKQVEENPNIKLNDNYVQMKKQEETINSNSTEITNNENSQNSSETANSEETVIKSEQDNSNSEEAVIENKQDNSNHEEADIKTKQENVVENAQELNQNEQKENNQVEQNINENEQQKNNKNEQQNEENDNKPEEIQTENKSEAEEKLEKITEQIKELESLQYEDKTTEDFNAMYEKLFGTKPIITEDTKEEAEKPKNTAVDLMKDNISVFEESEEYKKPVYKFIGIAFNTYIIIEMDKEMYIIDQHAAHERIMYEKVKNNYYSDLSKDSQMLLIPDVITLTHKEMEIARDNMDMFKKAGFSLEEFGENTIKLTGVPTVCIDLDNKELFLETLDEINTVARTAKQEKEEKFIATVACKAAVKANMVLTKEEVESLMDKLLELPNPFTCPHGRPTAIKMTKYDIERKFARK